MSKREIEKDLSGCEKLVMKAIWDSPDDIALQELILQMRTYGKNYARTTVVTFVHKLAEKGYVNSYRAGNAAFIHAEVKEEEYQSWLMKKEADFWFDGKVSELMSALLEGRKIPHDEIVRMRELLDGMED